MQVCWNTGILANWNCFWVQYLGLLAFFSLRIMGKNRKVPELPVAIGQKYAFFIYLFHLCVADILKDVAVAAGIEKNLLYLWMRPVMVCVLVTAVVVMYGYGMRICRK